MQNLLVKQIFIVKKVRSPKKRDKEILGGQRFVNGCFFVRQPKYAVFTMSNGHS